MDISSYSKRLTDIYIVANTAYFLIDAMRKSPYVQELSKVDTDELIAAFNSKANEEIKKTSQIAELYGIFIALTFKRDNKAIEFFDKAESIKFEWFSEIARYYKNELTYMVSSANIILKPKVSKVGVARAGNSSINFNTI